MILTARADINAPIEVVYEALTDVGAYQRMALRRNVGVKRIAGNGRVTEGAAWRLKLRFRSKDRQVRIEVTDVMPPEQIEMENSSAGIIAFSRLNLIRLSPGETRLAVRVKLKPQTLSARLIVQSLKLTRPAVTRRFTARIEKIGAQLEDRALRRSQSARRVSARS